MSQRFARSSSAPRFGSSAITIAVGAALMLFAGSPLASAQTTWTAGSTITLNSTFIVSDTLTIEPGVTVRLAAGVRLVISPSGTILVNGEPDQPVLFTSQDTSWSGLRFDPGSQGEITGAIIERCAQYGVEINTAAPLIQQSTIRMIGSTNFGAADAAAIRVYGVNASPTILNCVIDDVLGFTGFQGSSGSPGESGSFGADGGILFQDGEAGGNGSQGFSGFAGNQGASAYGVYLSSGARATIGYNTIRNIQGGQGGVGGTGGVGGQGGSGGDGWNGLAQGGQGAAGGMGGVGGWGGSGGSGGTAEAIRIESATTAQVYVFQNVIHSINAGQGGIGGRRGSGGWGGNGGAGGDCSAPFCNAGDGGRGGRGGDANFSGGFGGTGGTAHLGAMSNAQDVSFINNTIGDLRPGSPGFAGDGGSGGFGGTGGARGSASASGSNGVPGANGLNGNNSGPGGPGALGATTGVIASGNATQVRLYNNIIALNDANVMLSSTNGALITADYNNFSGYSTLFTGSTALGLHNVEGDPLFVDSAGGNLRLFSADSPALNAGSNALLPPDFLDLDDDEDITEPIPFDLDGNPRIADQITEMGAYEGVFTTQVYRNAADAWLNAGPAEAHAFDEFFPGIFNGVGCLSNSTDPVVIDLDGGTLTVSTFQGDNPICAIVDGSTTPAVSDVTLSNANANGLVVFEFDPPVIGFYTYFGSLALDRIATMRLYTDDGGDGLTLTETITTAPSANAVLASGMGFRSAVPVQRVEFTTSEPGGVVIGAFVGLANGEPSLGSVKIPDYFGPNGSIVPFDFACMFTAPAPCPPDVNGDGQVNFADLNIILSAFGQSGEDLPADTNGDGVVNFADLNAILTVFGVGCPS